MVVGFKVTDRPTDHGQMVETALMLLSYNLRRAISIKGVENMVTNYNTNTLNDFRKALFGQPQEAGQKEIFSRPLFSQTMCATIL